MTVPQLIETHPAPTLPRVLVTGGRGILGRALVACLRAAHYEVLTPARQQLDLTDGDAVRAYFQSQQPEWVFHLAAQVAGFGSTQEQQIDAAAKTIALDQHVLGACLDTPPVEMVFYSGSVASYGADAASKAQDGKFHEEHLFAGDPANFHYGTSKREAAHLMATLEQVDKQAVMGLITSLHGPGFYTETAPAVQAMVGRMHRAMMEDRSFTNPGSPDLTRDFLYAPDAAALIMEICKTGYRGRINIASGTSITMRELAHTMAEVMGFKHEIKWSGSGTVPYADIDISKLAGLMPPALTPLRQGLRATYEHFLSQHK